MRYFFVVILAFVSLSGVGQKRKLIYGYLKDSVTNAPIALASVRNISTNTTTMTGNDGRFSIQAAENHILSFAAVGYFFDDYRYRRGFKLLSGRVKSFRLVRSRLPVMPYDG